MLLGWLLGNDVGVPDGCSVGWVGIALGCPEGTLEGMADGSLLGSPLGCPVGILDG